MQVAHEGHPTTNKRRVPHIDFNGVAKESAQQHHYDMRHMQARVTRNSQVEYPPKATMTLELASRYRKRAKTKTNQFRVRQCKTLLKS
jgi:hypothetical protein